ncbi:MAG: phosphopantothenoylcysteine decarboxylase [Elusimicrobia bacterium]|nr:phosphopantothenoylcysteine decarboxylase [Elusimicrobiota bacterium]
MQFYSSLQLKKIFKNKKILITLGPTREYLDPVRYISNSSSGKMGLALAKAFKNVGAIPLMVCGPGVWVPPNLKSVDVVSALEMLEESKKLFSDCDIFICAAAIADYRPLKILKTKMVRGSHPLQIKLIPNPDILATVTALKKHQFCVGFALEDFPYSKPPALKVLKRARMKMIKKRCDLMVLNSARSMEGEEIDATLISSKGFHKFLGPVSKDFCAKSICQAIAQSLEL